VYHAYQNWVSVKKLNIQLRAPKNDRFVVVYLLDIKKHVYSLVDISSPMSNDDHFEAILDGLSEEFDSFVTSILSRLDPLYC